MALNAEHPWWHGAVVYQIYPRSFRDSNGDGIGDLKGIEEKLSYIADLGVDAIWISPFYPSPMADFGYDVADYCSVDAQFGTLSDFDALVARADELGVRVIIDFVPNHTSDQHPWFIEACESQASAHRDWYVFRDPKPDGSPPNNWVSVFGGPAWTWESKSEQYYLHSFLPEQPDLNWRNPEVEAAMFEVLDFWMKRGVAGFRIDVAHKIMKDPELRDNPPRLNQADHKNMGDYSRWEHIHDTGHADVHRAFAKIRKHVDDFDPSKDRVAIGEIHEFAIARWVTFYGQHGEGLHMPFNFGLLNVPFEAEAIAKHVNELEAALPAFAWPNYVLGNHDEPRVATRIGPKKTRLAAMLLLTLRGTPTLYYGDELGMQNVDVPPELEQDPWGKRVPGLNLSRDPARTPMVWNDTPSAGFSSAPPSKCWLPVGPQPAPPVSAAERDERSLLNLYKKLLSIRKEHGSLSVGKMSSLLVQDGVVHFSRWSPTARTLHVALNFSSHPIDLKLPEASTLLVRSNMSGANETHTRTLEVQPFEGVLYT